MCCMKDAKEKLGMLVRHMRVECGWSQEELASRSGLDRTYIGGVERGERNVSLLNIVKIAVALKVKPKTLLDFE